jgi:hypothetical protein
MNLELDIKNVPEDLIFPSYILLQLLYEKHYTEIELIQSSCMEYFLDLEAKKYIKLLGKPANWVIRSKTSNLFKNSTIQQSDTKLLAETIREIFPKGVKSGGYLVKSSVSDIEDKLKKFTKKYKYSDTIIIEATKRYVKEFQANNYRYMLLAKYFISKEDKGSTLADYCEMIVSNEEEDKPYIDTM